MKTAFSTGVFAVALALSAPALAQVNGETNGAALFKQNCSACHQPMGQGIEGAFPKLAGNTYVQGDPALVAGTVLNGRGGMPKFSSDLTDGQIAAVLSFVRSSWGNTAAPLKPEIVAKVRGDTGAPSPVPGGMQAH